MQAFTDNVAGSYSPGICGELRVTLDSPPAFLTLTADPVDPVTQPFSVIYTYSSGTAVESDIKTHTINYTVTSVEYSTYVTAITGSFSLIIECPLTPISWTTVTETADMTYDLASGIDLSITPPVVTSTPSGCFPISTYVFTVINPGPTTPTYVSASGTTIVINSQDWDLKTGTPHTVYI